MHTAETSLKHVHHTVKAQIAGKGTAERWRETTWKTGFMLKALLIGHRRFYSTAPNYPSAQAEAELRRLKLNDINEVHYLEASYNQAT